MTENEQESKRPSQLTTGTFVFGLVLGGLMFAMTYALCWYQATEQARALGIPQESALWTGACVTLGTIWVAVAPDLMRQSIRMGLMVGLSSGMFFDTVGAPNWFSIGVPTALGILVYWLHRKKEDVENIGDILQ